MTTFSEADVNKLKHLIKEGIQVTQEVETLREGLRDTVKAIAEEMDIKPSGEGRSRTDIGLPGVQQELLEEIFKVNKNIVLVLNKKTRIRYKDLLL